MNQSKGCAIITGGTGALGTYLAKMFLQDGFQIAVTYVFDSEVDPFLEHTIDFEQQVNLHQVDVTDPIQVQRFTATIIDQFKGIDVVANIAGGFIGGLSVSEMDMEKWDFMMDLNLKSVFLMCKAVLPHMVERGSGKIVNVSARAGLAGAAGMGAYCVSKAGVRTLTESIAEEVKDKGININAIMPSIIDTQANRQSMPKADFSKWVSPQKIAKVVRFLVSEDAQIINGAAIPVYGQA
ncbi:short-chain dehydrogenase [Candidatus Poribacteria bacterium]|nr:short-chain dehydrogenase [Candidatus Poribacteria bacterium]